MQQSVLFDIAEVSFAWWYCWPAAMLLLALIFPLLAHLILGEKLQGKQRRNFNLKCGGVAAAIMVMWLLFVGPATFGEYLHYRQMRADRGSDRLVEIEGAFVEGNYAQGELGGSSLSTFFVRDDKGVRQMFTARLTESIDLSDVRPMVSRLDRFRVSYVPRSDGRPNNALRIVLVPKSAP
jgi:hypothetical protein